MPDKADGGRDMSQSLTISDDLLTRLEGTARRRGLSVEQLLETWQAGEADPGRFAALV